MTSKTNQILQPENDKQKPIIYDLYYQKTGEPQPVIIFSHGYKGFKDWGPWSLAAKAFAEAGFCFLKFNFSHNGGTMDNPIDFPDLEAFAQNNYSIELDDLRRVIDFVEGESGKGMPEISTISLIGHSRGGGVSLIKAEEDPRVDHVIAWASVCDFEPRFRPDSEDFKHWEKNGVTYVENTRTHQQLPHYYQFYEDFLANKDRLSIKRAVKSMNKPMLILQGDDDKSVVMAEAMALHKWNPNSKLEVLPGADHVFGGKHPWNEEAMPEDLQKMVQKTIDFIN